MTRLAELQAARRTQIGRVREAWQDDPAGGFRSAREFYSCVISAFRGAGIDGRLMSRMATAGSDEQQTQDLQRGGFLVPEALLPGFSANTVPNDPIGPRVTGLQMPTTICHLPARVDEDHATSVAGGVTVQRREETGVIEGSLLEMRRITLEAVGLWGFAYATEELMGLAGANPFGAVLQRAFDDQMTSRIIKERLFGTGGGQFAGIMNSGCLISVSPDVSQPTATVSASNVVNMRSRCWNYTNEAIWLAHESTYPQLATLALGSGSAVTMLFVHSQHEGEPDMLAGRPIFFSEYCLPVGTPGDLICGNWSQWLEGTVQRGKADSMHVRFINHERALKFWTMNAGCPWWRVPLTPANSSTTLSPFVALQARP
jgi:HK97 family phage major capsid protein